MRGAGVPRIGQRVYALEDQASIHWPRTPLIRRPPLAAPPFRRPPGAAGAAADKADEAVWLRRCRLPPRVLHLARRLAARRGTALRDELFALSGFRRELYWRGVAAELSLLYLDDLAAAAPDPAAAPIPTEALRRAECARVILAGMPVLVLAPDGAAIGRLSAALRRTPELGARIRIAAPDTIRRFLLRHCEHAFTHCAVRRLAHAMPAQSARHLALDGRDASLSGPLAAVVAGLIVLPGPTLALLAAFLSLVFLNAVLWKLAAALHRPAGADAPPLADADLPAYSVLVPLHREAAVVPDLVRHLAALRYPRSKLQILIVVEADDAETLAALAGLPLPPAFEIVTVPPSQPRTKPKALVYALPFARGDYVAVFDAEDRPEPDQLRRVAARFRAEPELGCVQARLMPDHGETWLARMFGLEYAVNFEVLLPALADWGVPLPLGGTSNHFPRRLLQRIGAWDPFNVTEDADIGVRLARFGRRSACIASRTYEEAPLHWRQWLPQRRRWIKGWIQTALVALSPAMPAHRRLSWRQRLAVHAIITGGVLGLLFYPLSLVAGALCAAAWLAGRIPDTPVAWTLLAINAGNGVALIAATLIAGWRGAAATGRRRSALLLLHLPIYWALMSLAAWQALYLFARRPWAWEKTAHGIATRRQTPFAA